MSELLSSNFYNLFGLNADFDFVARLNLQINEVLYPKGFIYKKGVKYSGFVVSNHEHDIVLLYQLKQDLIQLQIFVPFGNASNQWINSNPEEKLYRYSDYQWNFLALTKGSFRLNRSLFYSLEENNPARLDNEHLFNKTITSELHPSYTTSNGVTHSIESPLLLSTMDRDINKYLLCFSYLCNDSLYEHFGESCLIIHDPEEFERRLMNVMMERYPFLVGISSRVSYSKQEHELGILFTKDSNFKYQYEYRFLWFSDSKPEPVSYEIMSNSELLRKLVKFWEYARTMFLPNLLSIFASIAVLWLFFRRDIPTRIDVENLATPESAIKNMTMFRLSWWFLGLLMVGYFIGDAYHLPISVFALGGALVFLAIATYYKATKPIATIKAAPWQVVWFSIGLYVVVYGLKNGGLTTYLAGVIMELQSMGNIYAVIGTGFLSAILSSVMNNMPTIMIMDIAIAEAGNSALAYANIIGCNLGPKMTPIGSLATLLWLHVLAQKGVKIGWGEYMKVGLVITPPVLLVALLGLI